jgi:hypothetical protein
MKSKALAIGVLALTLSTPAAIAASPIANHLTLTPVICSGSSSGIKAESVEDSAFSRVVKGVYQGGPGEDLALVGFRLDANNIKTCSFTLTQTGSPDLEFPVYYRFNFETQNFFPSTGLTVTPLQNGASRYSFDVRNSQIPVSGKVTSLYVMSQCGSCSFTLTGSNFLGNGMTVTGIPLVSFDCDGED